MARPVWLVPYYTEDINKACTSFKVIQHGQKGYDPQFKIPVGLESQGYPCLISICDQGIQSKVSHVLLVPPGMEVISIHDRYMATSFIACVHSPASGYFYLMWK